MVAAMVIVITSSGVSSLNARVSACFGYKVTGCHVLATVDGQATGVCDGGYEFGEESGSVSC